MIVSVQDAVSEMCGCWGWHSGEDMHDDELYYKQLPWRLRHNSASPLEYKILSIKDFLGITGIHYSTVLFEHRFDNYAETMVINGKYVSKFLGHSWAGGL